MKIITLVCALVMVLSMVGCGNSEASTVEETKKNEATTSSTKVEETKVAETTSSTETQKKEEVKPTEAVIVETKADPQTTKEENPKVEEPTVKEEKKITFNTNGTVVLSFSIGKGNNTNTPIFYDLVNNFPCMIVQAGQTIDLSAYCDWNSLTEKAKLSFSDRFREYVSGLQEDGPIFSIGNLEGKKIKFTINKGSFSSSYSIALRCE